MHGAELESLLRDIHGKLERAAGEFSGFVRRVEQMEREGEDLRAELQTQLRTVREQAASERDLLHQRISNLKARVALYAGIAIGLSLLSLAEALVGFLEQVQ